MSLDTEPFCITLYHENPLSAREGSEEVERSGGILPRGSTGMGEHIVAALICQSLSHPLDTRQNCIVYFAIEQNSSVSYLKKERI
jgi:hypothetical protein